MDNDDYINSYQRWVETTVAPSIKGDVDWAIIAMCSEVGEFAQLREKYLRKGTAFDTDSIISELGDILWYVAYIASMKDITLSDMMLYNIEKLEARKNEAAKAD